MAITLKCHTTSLGIAAIYLHEPDYYKGLKGSGQKSGVSLRRSFDCDSKAAVHWLIGNLTPHLISCYEPQAQQTHQITIKSYKNKTIARRQRNTPQLTHIFQIQAQLLHAVPHRLRRRSPHPQSQLLYSQALRRPRYS